MCVCVWLGLQASQTKSVSFVCLKNILRVHSRGRGNSCCQVLSRYFLIVELLAGIASIIHPSQTKSRGFTQLCGVCTRKDCSLQACMTLSSLAEDDLLNNSVVGLGVNWGDGAGRSSCTHTHAYFTERHAAAPAQPRRRAG